MPQYLVATILLLTFSLSSAVTVDAQLSEFGLPGFEKNAETYQALSQTISVEYRDVTLAYFIEDIRKQIGVQILLDETLWDNGLDEDTPFTLSLVEVRACSVMKILLGPQDCTYRIEDGVIHICSVDVAIDRPSRYVIELASSQIEKDKLSDVITNIVDPDSWEYNGGYAHLVFYDQKLTIRQTEDNFRKIHDLLIALELAEANQTGA